MSCPPCSACWSSTRRPRATGENLWGLVNGEASARDHLVQAYGWVGGVRTKDWQFSKIIDREKLGYDFETQLYDRAEDPDELTNVAGSRPDVVADLTAKMEAYLESGKELTLGSFHAREDYDGGDPDA